MRDKVLNVVKSAIEELNKTLINKVELERGESTPLYGQQGILDSLALVSLIVTVESEIENEFGNSIILANEKSLSQKNSPFNSIGSLVDYIIHCLEEKPCQN